MRDVSIVICAYTEKRWDDIVAAVDSCRIQTLQPLEIILISDYNDALADRMQATFPDVRVVPNTREKGLSGARNAAIDAATGDFIAFLDDDAVAAPDWLALLRARCESPEVNGAGGRAEPAWTGSPPRWFPREFLWIVGCTHLGMPETAGPTRNLIGCSMLIRRDVCVAVGGFRTELGRQDAIPYGAEETEFCIRACQLRPGSLFLYDPASVIRHRVTPQRQTVGYYLRRCYAEGISKAFVSASVGAGDGLSAERSYVLRVLPKGVARGLADLLRGDVHGPLRAAAIVAGLGATVAGYAAGSVRLRLRGRAGPRAGARAA